MPVQTYKLSFLIDKLKFLLTDKKSDNRMAARFSFCLGAYETLH
ncbi:hypothetical protein HMPREF3293_02147 [Christensenella minuta]|uniref:Uncharacterized protein n=1 Tax=Christensenella minuta TaxID=626937 RepID=A0A136Q2H9_9FIRM|nr:hypothetical protein HMPREF3293_02147 [Christensenella minuta]